MDYEPWKITRVLYGRRGTTIYETTDSRWVLKDVEDNARSVEELAVILRMVGKTIRHSVMLSPSLYGLYGRTPVSGWYAMKRYDGIVEVNTYCKDRWRILAVQVLRFLQDFHHTLRLVHMDIKKANILIDRAANSFAVADYEHAEAPSASLTCNYDPDYEWYYMAMGAELDQPLKAWRFDLVALGYVLASLTPAVWTFEKECWEKRIGNGFMLAEEVVALRELELQGADPVICAYLERVKEIPWSAVDPPARSVYDDLEKLFISASKVESVQSVTITEIR